MKYIFLALGLLTTIACNDAGPESKASATDTLTNLKKDTGYTTISVATLTRRFEAKVFYQSRMVDTFEPANADSSLYRPIRMKVWDKKTFVHVIDTVVEKNKPPRPIDTFVEIDTKFIVEDLGIDWRPKIADTTKKVDTTKKK